MLDKEMCKNCNHGYGEGNCITKQEAPFGAFECENNEQFEEYEE